MNEKTISGIKRGCGLLTTALMVSFMMLNSAEALSADRGGTVGLILVNAEK